LSQANAAAVEEIDGGNQDHERPSARNCVSNRAPELAERSGWN
jgi:hypothetical protein